MKLNEYYDKLKSAESKADRRNVKALAKVNGPAFVFLLNNWENIDRPSEDANVKIWHIFGALSLMGGECEFVDSGIKFVIKPAVGRSVSATGKSEIKYSSDAETCIINVIGNNLRCDMDNGDIFGFSLDKWIDCVDLFHARYNWI